MQNAFEASQKLKDSFIKVEIVDHESESFISIYNSCENMKISSCYHLETSKEDKTNHGFGLKNIVSVVNRYHGEYYLLVEQTEFGQIFKLDVSLPRRNN